MKAGSSLRSLTFPRLMVTGLSAAAFAASLEAGRVTGNTICSETIQPCSINQPPRPREARKPAGPRRDLQQHRADLEAVGLLIRIDRPINKDTELIPLVRWQFIGGMPED